MKGSYLIWLLNQFLPSNDGTYFIICLLGKIKGENVDRRHLIPCSSVTSSGIWVNSIIDRLRVAKNKAGFKDGPAIYHAKGRVYSTSELDGMLISLLKDFFKNKRLYFLQRLNILWISKRDTI